jgi:subtilisin family serine protease
MVGIRPLSLAILMLALVPASVLANSAPQIIVEREAGLSAAERRDIRADADVRFVESLPLSRTEVVAARPGDLQDALRDLNADPDVVRAEYDRPIRASASDDPYFNWLWGLENRGDLNFEGITEVADADTDAPEAWVQATGAGQMVAVVDTGVDLDHPDLATQLLAGYDFVDEDPTPEDELPPAPKVGGHGTHVTGTIAAVKDNQEGVAGVAPGAQVLPLRALDASGEGFVSDAIQAYNTAGSDGARVLNASLGGVGAVEIERQAIEANDDVLFVVAAGNAGANNDNPSTAEFPCSYELENVLCVGASRPDDRRAGFSNYGASTVDLFAPGYGIFSTVPDNDYDWKDGTSMATPHVAGAAALVLEAAPQLTPAEVKAVLLQSGDYQTALGGLSVTGRRLNADAAVDLALSGGPQLDSDGDGFADTEDACPSEASSQLANGCPDQDRDGRTDSEDNCPAVVNDQANADGDQLGDACDPTPRGPDTDRDGKPQLDDSCPNEYGTLSNGCPAPSSPPPPPPPSDRDHDGVADVSDACPGVPAATPNGCPLAQVSGVSTKVRKRGKRRSATIRIATNDVATLRVTVERKKGRRWVRVTRRTLATSGNLASVRVSRLKRGTHRVRISISNSAGSGTSISKTFRVR